MSHIGSTSSSLSLLQLPYLVVVVVLYQLQNTRYREIDILDDVGLFNVHGYSFAHQCLDKDLHISTKSQDHVDKYSSLVGHTVVTQGRFIDSLRREVSTMH